MVVVRSRNWKPRTPPDPCMCLAISSRGVTSPRIFLGSHFPFLFVLSHTSWVLLSRRLPLASVAATTTIEAHTSRERRASARRMRFVFINVRESERPRSCYVNGSSYRSLAIWRPPPSSIAITACSRMPTYDGTSISRDLFWMTDLG